MYHEFFFFYFFVELFRIVEITINSQSIQFIGSMNYLFKDLLGLQYDRYFFLKTIHYFQMNY